MALLSAGQLTLADAAKRLDASGNTVKVAEVLSQANPILEDAVFLEANGSTGHLTTIRTGLPKIYYRMINQGIPTSKSTTTQVTETFALLEGRSHVDVRLATLSSNPAAFRATEDVPFQESFAQKAASDLFYGNPGTDPRQYAGLTTRFSSLGAGNGANVLDAGGTSTNNSSVWLVNWGEGSVFCTYPKGSKAGLQMRDLGEETVYDANNNGYQAYRSLFMWDNGLVVQDWRQVVRIANINMADLLAQANTQAIAAPTAMINMMSRAIDHLPSIGGGRKVFYTTRTGMSLLRLVAMNKSSAAVTIEAGLNQFGQTIQNMMFLGIPVRSVDQLLGTESRVQ